MNTWTEPNPRESLRDKVLSGEVDAGNMCISMPTGARDIELLEEQARSNQA